MRENTECLNNQVQGAHDAETRGHNATNNCKENYFAPDVPQNIPKTTLSYVDYDNLIQELDEIQELLPNYGYNIEDNQNIANYINENTNDTLTGNELDIDAIVEKRFDEIMFESNIQSVPSAELGYEQQNLDRTMYGEEISNESNTCKDAVADNCRSADTYEIEITNTLNDTLINISEALQLNYIKASDADRIEMKNVSVKDALSEFLNFHNSNKSVEASKEDNISSSNLGEEKNEGKESLKKIVGLTKKYKCDWCDSEFTNKKDATKHVTDKHGIRYKCTEYEFSTTDIYKLMNHTRRHTGEKPYACDFCNYRSRRKDMLTKHSLIHNNNKPFTCITCNLEFKSLSSLKRHIKKYCAVNRCTLCRMQFASATDLVHHIKTKTHDDYESPYICSVCGLKYKTKHGHSRHVKTHTHATTEINQHRTATRAQC